MKFAPLEGELIEDEGGVVSVDFDAATRPDCREPGCAPISASTLTIACLMSGSSGVVGPS